MYDSKFLVHNSLQDCKNKIFMIFSNDSSHLIDSENEFSSQLQKLEISPQTYNNLLEERCIVFENGDIFHGSLDQINKLPTGVGVLKNDQKGYQAIGHFLNGKLHGKGLEIKGNDSIYIGDFQDNKREGCGEEKLNTGELYIGEFINDKRHGYGVLTDIFYTVVSDTQSFSIKQKLKFNQQLKLFYQHCKSKGATQLKENNQEQKNLIEPQQQQEQQEVGVKESQPGKTFDDLRINPLSICDTSYFEGQFHSGMKNGFGRQFDKNGSYMYGYYQYDKPIGEIVIYQSESNHWEIDVIDEQGIQTVVTKGKGLPPDEIDCFKSQIDKLGYMLSKAKSSIKNQIQDESFPETSLNEILVDPKYDFAANLTLLYTRFQQIKSKIVLAKLPLSQHIFSQEICPGKLQYNELSLSNPQVIACIELLSYYPELILKMFSNKYDTQKLCYVTMISFVDKQLQETVLTTCFPTTKKQMRIFNELTQTREHAQSSAGIQQQQTWHLFIEKLIAKLQGHYINALFNDETAPKYILETLTGFPCEKVDCENENQFENWLTLEPSKIFKANTGLQFPQICIQKRKKTKEKGIPENFPYLLLNIIKIPQQQQQQFKQFQFEEIQQQSESDQIYFIIESLSEKNILQDIILSESDQYIQICMDFMSKNLQQYEQSQQETYKKIQDVDYRKRIFALNRLQFDQSFSWIYQLKGLQIPNPLHQFNYFAIEKNYTINQQYFSESKLFSFNLTEDHCQVLINIIQMPKKNANLAQKSKIFVPCRVILLRQENFNQENDQAQFQQFKFHEQFEKSPLLSNFKYFDMQHVYMQGIGQVCKENVIIETSLPQGKYLIYIQYEGSFKLFKDSSIDRAQLRITCSHVIDLHEEMINQQAKSLMIENAYKQRILSEFLANQEQIVQQNYESFSDGSFNFTAQNKGQIDVVTLKNMYVMQLYLRDEGSYVQLFWNNTNENYRQKINFNAENMKLFNTKAASNLKVDIKLNHDENKIVVLQQIDGKEYILEGGEGTCVQPQDKIKTKKIAYDL